jgi:DNA mismatch endonuclease, patch repair protein
MADTVDKATRSRIMSRVRGTNTKPERLLRQALWAEGTRFRIHDRSVPGTPDISHKGARVAVFVDGCFWHGCPRHYKRPASRQAFWDGKLAYNHDLRRRVKERLRLERWHIVEVWECNIKANPAKIAPRIATRIRARRLK